MPPELLGQTERLFRIEVIGLDWNCPKFITPRFTREELAGVTQPLTDRIAELEAELARLRS
ncbi:hypothetical protein Hhel01_03038 [Haloferula helveola]